MSDAMVRPGGLPDDVTLFTQRLVLEPLRAADSDELFELIRDPRLYVFLGEHHCPPSVEALRGSRTQTHRTSLDCNQRWWSWLARLKEDHVPVASLHVQMQSPSGPIELGWMTGMRWQRQGFAKEAMVAICGWLKSWWDGEVMANMHPHNVAAAKLSAAIGMSPSGVVSGVSRWSAASPDFLGRR